MALPFLKPATAKAKEQLVSVDLGGRTTKAVQIQRKRSGFAISHFAVLDAPVYDKSPSPELLGEHLKNVCTALGSKPRTITLAVGVNDSLVRHTEMPLMQPDDMRQILKMNSKTYLQQELPDYVFDCHFAGANGKGKTEKPKATGDIVKSKVLVAGAKRQFVDYIKAAVKHAGLAPEAIVPGVVGPANALELAMPELYSSSILALVDIGFKSTSISILQQGDLVLNRVVNIGGDNLTSGLAEMMNISYAEAEGIKIGMAAEVESQLEMLVSPLARELRASIDFFEHQQEHALPLVYVSGGSARSEFIVKTLRQEIGIECKTWNQSAGLQVELPAAQLPQFESVAPQLNVAIGAALAAI
jgi:type IV pilus assembly protein PilM